MGAWGEEPMDSDQALDWLGNVVTDTLQPKLEKVLEAAENGDVADVGYELRAAADVALTLNFWQDGEVLFQRFAAALRALAKSEFAESYNRPDLFRESVAHQVALLDLGPRGTGLLEALGE
jgi:hypothetical protein